MYQARLMRGAGCALLATLAACGGGSMDKPAGTNDRGSSVTANSPGGNSITSAPTSSSSSGSSSSTSGSGSSTSSSGGSSSVAAAAGPAAKLAANLQLPSRLLVGLGSQSNTSTKSAIESQNLKPDIYEVYLT